MLDDTIREQIRGHLAALTHPVHLVAAVDGGDESSRMLTFLAEVSELSDHVELDATGHADRRPSFTVERADGPKIGSISFAGTPLGHELTSFVLALLQVGGVAPRTDDRTRAAAAALEGEHRFETYFSLSCQNCPDTVQALNALAVLNPNIHHVAIDGALFSSEVDERQVMAVPSVFCDGEMWGSGRMSLEELVAKLDSGAADREAERLQGEDPFEVLVVGGGPAGAAAAIYSARKGIRTGVVTERFGGQVLDTMAIENFISVPYTEGPKLVTALEQHVKDYEVDVMNSQRAAELIPAERSESGLVEVRLESGATLASRSVVISTGARWRSMDVPGEAEYRNKGVTYCPHCDGPLFKGKRVAVIGGGNSGVEAAIDLAGVARQVTLIEFDAQLRADEVLQRKLRSLPNVDIIVSALTTEVLGDGDKVTGLTYTDRTDDESHTVELDGIFVQIGLLPNSEWLDGSVELSPRGEVVVDERGQTSVPGVFAAGDCTTVPYKQIVIAMGAGATASLSAFDHLIRTSAPEGAEGDKEPAPELMPA